MPVIRRIGSLVFSAQHPVLYLLTTEKPYSLRKIRVYQVITRENTAETRQQPTDGSHDL